jgi:cytoskeletal protein RodZ
MPAGSTAARPRKLPPGVEIESPRESVLDSEFPAAQQKEETMASFGEELRRQRELRSITLREISDATKINIRFLEALEQNDFKHLPGGQFNKGFIRAYARHVGVNGDEMVNAYLLETKTQDDGGRPGSRAAAVRGGASALNPRLLIAGGLAALILLAMAAITWTVVRSSNAPGKARGHSGAAPRESGSAPKLDSQPGAAQGKPTGSEATQAETGNERGAQPPISGESTQSSTPAPPASAQEAAGGSDAGATGNGNAQGVPPQGPAGTSNAGTNTGGANPPPGVPPSPNPVVSGSGLSAASAPAAVPESASPAPVPPRPDQTRDTRRAAPTGGPIALRVIPFHPVRFELMCSGKPLHSGVLAVGVPLSFECQGVYEVSLEDAGAVSMSVNGERIYLGRPGQPVAGRHVSSSNYQDYLNAPSEAAPQ